jgi:hypothetical protein
MPYIVLLEFRHCDCRKRFPGSPETAARGEEKNSNIFYGSRGDPGVAMLRNFSRTVVRARE